MSNSLFRPRTNRLRSDRRHRSALTVAGLTVAGLLLAAPIASADSTVAPSTNAASAGDSSTDLPQEEVAALTQSGVVYIAVEYRGYVQYQTSSGPKWSGLIKADGSCTGFVASSDGYVVTAGHCADPVEGRKDLIESFLSQAIQSGDITTAEAQSLEQGAIQNWKVEGDNNGSAIIRELKVEQVGAAAGLQVAQATTANVVDNRPLDQGDVTLLKIETPAPLPILQVADSVPDVGSNIAAVGFPGAVDQVVDPNLEPSYKTGRVSANQTFNGSPFTQVDAAFSPGMSGGPVVNMQGQVVGIVSYNPTGTQSFNFAAGQETVSGLLTRNGVKAVLTPADQAFRQGLDLYFGKKYREAAAQFDIALGTEPSHAMAQKYKAKALANFGNEPAAATTAAAAASNAAPAVSAPANAAPAIANAAASTGNSGSTPIWVWLLIALLVLGVGAGAAILLRRRGTAATNGSGAHAAPVYANAGAVTSYQPSGYQPSGYQSSGYQSTGLPSGGFQSSGGFPSTGGQPAYQPYGAAPLADPNATQVVSPTSYRSTGTQALPATRQCTQCGSATAASARFCDNCGAPTGPVLGQSGFSNR